MKIKVKSKDFKLTVGVKLSKNETVNPKMLDTFSRAYLRGFLKPVLTKNDTLEYTGPIAVALDEKLKKPVTKREFLFVIEQIVVAAEKLKKRDLPINNMVMHTQNIFINEVTREIQFLYVPIIQGFENSNIIRLIEEIIYCAKPMRAEDAELISKFTQHFRMTRPFDLSKIEAFITREDRDVVTIVRKKNAGNSGVIKDKQFGAVSQAMPVADPVPMKHARPVNTSMPAPISIPTPTPLAELIDVPDETGVLYSEDGYGDYPETGSMDSDAAMEEFEENMGTMLLAPDEVPVKPVEAQVHYPSLVRVSNDEEIIINKCVFRIGRRPDCTNYAVAGNPAISGKHIDIMTRDSRYFIKDLSSMNHTYVNNQEIPPEVEIEIFDGASVFLGNEEFVFKA